MERRRCPLLSLLVLVCTPCFSEPDPKLLTGSVTDKRGNELAQAVVELEDETTLRVRSYITSANGEFHFAGVDPETDYKLTARYRTHWSKQRYLSRYDSPKRHNLRVVIPVD